MSIVNFNHFQAFQCVFSGSVPISSPSPAVKGMEGSVRSGQSAGCFYLRCFMSSPENLTILSGSDSQL